MVARSLNVGFEAARVRYKEERKEPKNAIKQISLSLSGDLKEEAGGHLNQVRYSFIESSTFLL